jgi:hypothetical protein
MRSIRLSSLIVGVVLVVLLVAAASLALADGQDAQADARGTPDREGHRHACSLADIRGTYGFRNAGIAFKPDGTHGNEFASGGIEVFDGAGHVGGTFSGNNSLLGAIAGTFTGTVSVKTDCTGTDDTVFTITQPPALAGVTGHEHFDIVIVEGGRHMIGHGTEPEQNSVEQADGFRL